MKSFFKKLAFVMALAMVVSLAAPAAKSALAATEFTYAEQESGAKVTVLNLKAGEEMDLKFIGVKDYKNYTLEWVSSNPAVAKVDQSGNVTAVADKGTAEIELKVGDGTVYTSTPVKVVVGEEMKVVLGTSKADTFAEKTLKVGEKIDLNFYGVTDWVAGKYNCTWVSTNPTVVNPDKNGIVTGLKAGKATVTVVITNNATGAMLTVTPVEFTVETPVDELTATQTTATKVTVKFTSEHQFDATGTDEDGKNTVKIYRVFSTEEMAQMSNKNGLKFDEAGNGYQAYYIKNATSNTDDATTWTIEGYNAFVDGAKYAVVYGENETSSTIEGIKDFFTAYVGKVAYIKISATDATIENEVEPSIAAVLTTRLYNSHDIDLTDYYKNADETDYELLSEDVEASVSGNEVTFDEPGKVLVQGTYTFYDEDKEEDVPCTATVEVKGSSYSTYRVESIFNWSLASGYKAKWTATTTEMIAGDADQLYVVVKDNRGNYYSNVPGIETQGYYIDGKQVLEIGDDIDNTAFEQYGYELVFDSLDPDSLLVDADGYVESYKKTNSFAVVSYKNTNAENPKLHEIGVMGITVKAARKLDDVVYNKTSFTVLKETEAEDGTANYYGSYSDFQLTDTLTATFKNQYNGDWNSTAEDWGEVETHFTVTTTKDAFDNVAEAIADALNDEEPYIISASMFEGTSTTSVSFKIKESATNDSTTITIKLDKPKYVTTSDGVEIDEVYVDPTKAIMSVSGVEMYLGLDTTAKLFQVSKANQKIGYFRIGTLEENDEEHSYYVANDLTKNFIVKPGDALNFVSTASGSAVTALNEEDYVLVVTDPQGNVFPTVGNGGNGKSFAKDSLLGIEANDDGTGFILNVAAVKESGEMEYAVNGTYRATVYKITSIVENKNTNGDVISIKYNTSRVASDSFVISKNLKDVTFYHQETTKDVEIGSFSTKEDIIRAISETMTFKINGAEFNIGTTGRGTYQSYMKVGDNYVSLPIEIDAVDYKIQNDGSRAVINTVTFKVYTPAGGYYLSKVKVNRSVNAAE